MTPAGFEPAIFAVKGRCPRPLDEGATQQHYSKQIVICQLKTLESTGNYFFLRQNHYRSLLL